MISNDDLDAHAEGPVQVEHLLPPREPLRVNQIQCASHTTTAWNRMDLFFRLSLSEGVSPSF